MLKQTLRKKAIERIKELNNSLKLRGNDIINESYKLIKVMDTKGYQTAIIKAQWGFVIMQIKNGLSKISELWLTDSEFNVMVDAKMRKITIETVERKALTYEQIREIAQSQKHRKPNPKLEKFLDENLETYG